MRGSIHLHLILQSICNVSKKSSILPSSEIPHILQKKQMSAGRLLCRHSGYLPLGILSEHENGRGAMFSGVGPEGKFMAKYQVVGSHLTLGRSGSPQNSFFDLYKTIIPVYLVYCLLILHVNEIIQVSFVPSNM